MKTDWFTDWLIAKTVVSSWLQELSIENTPRVFSTTFCYHLSCNRSVNLGPPLGGSPRCVSNKSKKRKRTKMNINDCKASFSHLAMTSAAAPEGRQSSDPLCSWARCTSCMRSDFPSLRRSGTACRRGLGAGCWDRGCRLRSSRTTRTRSPVQVIKGNTAHLYHRRH